MFKESKMQDKYKNLLSVLLGCISFFLIIIVSVIASKLLQYLPQIDINLIMTISILGSVIIFFMVFLSVIAHSILFG